MLSDQVLGKFLRSFKPSSTSSCLVIDRFLFIEKTDINDPTPSKKASSQWNKSLELVSFSVRDLKICQIVASRKPVNVTMLTRKTTFIRTRTQSSYFFSIQECQAYLLLSRIRPLRSELIQRLKIKPIASIKNRNGTFLN